MNDDELFIDPPGIEMVDQDIEENEEAEADLLDGFGEFEAEGQMIPDGVVDAEKDSTNYEEYIDKTEDDNHD